MRMGVIFYTDDAEVHLTTSYRVKMMMMISGCAPIPQVRLECMYISQLVRKQYTIELGIAFNTILRRTVLVIPVWYIHLLKCHAFTRHDKRQHTCRRAFIKIP